MSVAIIDFQAIAGASWNYFPHDIANQWLDDNKTRKEAFFAEIGLIINLGDSWSLYGRGRIATYPGDSYAVGIKYRM